MKLLYIDDINIQSITRTSLLEQMGKAEIKLCGSFKEYRELFEHAHYDIVIIDFSIDEGTEILEDILKTSPKQKVITLSASEGVSENSGCAYCQEHYKKRRLNKPVSIHDLLNLIKDFDLYQCEHYTV